MGEKDKFAELRKVLAPSLDWILENEAEKLREAVEGEKRNSCVGGFTTSDKRCANLLVGAGLLKPVFTFNSSGKTEYLYQATEKGCRLYNLIFGDGNRIR